MKWKPMDSAPKDGTHILLRFPDDEGVFAVIEGWWDTEWYPERWSVVRIDRHGCGCCASDTDQPTGWLELPEVA